MDVKVPLNSGAFTTDVPALPSAPPPSYEDSCAATASVNIYPSSPYPDKSTTPLIKENYPQASPAPAPVPIQAQLLTGHSPYPVQQVQVTPAVFAANPNRILPVGRHPLKTTCPVCNVFISSRIRVKNRCSPTFWCIVMFCTGICMFCSCLPYFFCNGPLTVEHFCPKCNAFLGSYVQRS